MPYYDTDFDKDIETALRMQSGFKGPIVPEAPGEPVAEYRNDPGYAQRQAALAAPGQRQRGISVDMDEVDRYLFGQRVKQMEGGWGGREAAVDYALQAWQGDIDRSMAETDRRFQEDKARRELETNLGLKQAQTEKLRAEAEEARGKIGMPKTPTDVVIKAAGERRVKRGETGPPTGEDMLEVQSEQAGDVAQKKSRVPTAGIREKAGALKATMQGITKLRAEHDPIFTGQEAPVGKLAKYFGAENPAFQRFRARAQAIYAPARKELIGAAQTPQEAENINRVLPPDITSLSDIEAVAAMEILMDQTQMTLSNLEGQFRLEAVQGTKPTTREKWGRDAQGRLVRQ